MFLIINKNNNFHLSLWSQPRSLIRTRYSSIPRLISSLGPLLLLSMLLSEFGKLWFLIYFGTLYAGRFRFSIHFNYYPIKFRSKEPMCYIARFLDKWHDTTLIMMQQIPPLANSQLSRNRLKFWLIQSFAPSEYHRTRPPPKHLYI